MALAPAAAQTFTRASAVSVAGLGQHKSATASSATASAIERVRRNERHEELVLTDLQGRVKGSLSSEAVRE